MRRNPLRNPMAHVPCARHPRREASGGFLTHAGAQVLDRGGCRLRSHGRRERTAPAAHLARSARSWSAVRTMPSVHLGNGPRRSVIPAAGVIPAGWASTFGGIGGAADARDAALPDSRPVKRGIEDAVPSASPPTAAAADDAVLEALAAGRRADSDRHPPSEGKARNACARIGAQIGHAGRYGRHFIESGLERGGKAG